MVCKSTLKSKGFTEKLIKELLPEPTLRPNPHYKSAPMMQLWEESDVEEAMMMEQFRIYQETRIKKQEAAKKAVETKTAKLIDDVEALIPKITVQRFTMDKLRNKTLSNKREWYNYQNNIRGHFEESVSFKNTDEETIKRWMVNYLRHHCTKYDSDLEILFGRTGKDRGYMLLKNAVLEKIAEVYPELREECENQKAV